MPEDPEIETEELHEAIMKELEREGGSFLKQISITTAILAVLAAIASLQAGATVNMALVLKTEATRLQSEASDQWAYYQAKGIKAAVLEASRTAWLAIDKEPPAVYEDKMHRYAKEQKEIQDKAREKERERDERLKESDHLLHKHHGFASAVALFQVSIALGAVSALTRYKLVWFGSLLTGGVGIIFFVWPMFQ
jgi:transcription-repair coupling factor (superfamily II helicase)